MGTGALYIKCIKVEENHWEIKITTFYWTISQYKLLLNILINLKEPSIQVLTIYAEPLKSSATLTERLK